MTYVPPHIRQQYPNLPHSAHVNIYAALPVGPPPAVTSQADYGAIAYDSSTGQFGWSWGYANVEEAKRRAMRAVWPNGVCLAWGSNMVLALAKCPSGAEYFPGAPSRRRMSPRNPRTRENGSAM